MEFRGYPPTAVPCLKSSGKSLQTLLDMEQCSNEMSEIIHTISSTQEPDTNNLNQLLCAVKSCKATAINSQDLSAVLSFVSGNLIRPLPPPTANFWFLYDEQMLSSPSPIWQQLQIIYDVLLKIVLKVDAKVLSNFVDKNFLGNLINLFQSEDLREREKVKNVYYQIYSKLPSHRPFMRKSMNDFLLHSFDDSTRQCIGISELLEIYGSIINGFTLPLKEEHKLFLTRVLIPLHKTESVRFYHRQLCYCLNRFVAKEPGLCFVVVKGILKYWPVRNCQKEVLMIGEVEEIVELMDPAQYSLVALHLCSQITRCFNSPNTQVAERALYLWNNELFVRMASSATKEVIPIVVEAVEKNLRWHWSKSVKHLTGFVKNLLQEIEPKLYQKCLEEMDLRETEVQRQQIKRKERWERIELAAAAKIPSLEQLHCICLF